MPKAAKSKKQRTNAVLPKSAPAVVLKSAESSDEEFVGPIRNQELAILKALDNVEIEYFWNALKWAHQNDSDTLFATKCTCKKGEKTCLCFPLKDGDMKEVESPSPYPSHLFTNESPGMEPQLQLIKYQTDAGTMVQLIYNLSGGGFARNFSSITICSGVSTGGLIVKEPIDNGDVTLFLYSLKKLFPLHFEYVGERNKHHNLFDEVLEAFERSIL